MNATVPATLPKYISKKKQALFIALIIGATIVAGLILAEGALRLRINHITKSDHLEKGLVVYHNRLGWIMRPYWQGRHHHYDFDVRYSTNAFGFRGEFQTRLERSKMRVAMVGDSFTFGIGVNDEDTFCEKLNHIDLPDIAYFNFGVPGYSTDQELLLIEDQVFRYSPTTVILVAYLGNDIFDNQLSFPLQADQGKPFFEMLSGKPVLHNVPVPLGVKPDRLRKNTLETMVLGDDAPLNHPVENYLRRFTLFRLFEYHMSLAGDFTDHFEKRFASPLQLFFGLMGEIHQLCIDRGIRFGMVLFPGKSFVENPASLSGQFQDYLRYQILNTGESMGIPVFDLANKLREQYRHHSGQWFFPNEGHLTVEGNRVVAELLKPFIDQVQSTGKSGV